MMDLLLTIPILASFLIVLFLMPLWIRKAKQIGLVWDDMNKLKSEKVAGSGGIIVLSAFIISVFIFVAYRTFYLHNYSYLTEIISIVAVMLLVGGIGFIDDLFGWQHGGLSRRTRMIMVALASIPLMAINAGKQAMSIPLIGTVDFGWLYPLVLIPLGVVGTTTTFNFLAGMNGLEAGLGAILISSLSLVALFTGNTWLALIGLCMVLALLAFLFYNFTPAKVFPGGVLTYPVGALIAIMAILGNFEKIAIFFFIPCIIEVILKARGKLVKSSFGKPQKDGSLDLLHGRVYGLTHASIWIFKKAGIKPTEKRVVYLIWIFQALVVLAGFVIFRKGIF